MPAPAGSKTCFPGQENKLTADKGGSASLPKGASNKNLKVKAQKTNVARLRSDKVSPEANKKMETAKGSSKGLSKKKGKGGARMLQAATKKSKAATKKSARSPCG